MDTANNLSKRTFLLASFIVVLLLFATNNVKAQASPKAKVTLSEQEWKAVTGIFQSAQNSDMNVQFSVSNNMLVAKLLWNNNELHLSPETPLVFSSNQEGNQEPVRITFIKDSSGAINAVNVANNGVWKRNNNYKPLERKEIQLPVDQLKQFEGLYKIQGGENKFLQFSVKEGHLLLTQQWDGREQVFAAQSEMDFFAKGFPLFTLNFSKDKEGHVSQVIAFKTDVWIKQKEPALSLNQLKLYEGKFRSKDDPDNMVQLTVMNNHLVLIQLWDKKQIVLTPRAEEFFYSQAEFYPVVIVKNKDGIADQITILGTDDFTRVH